MHPLRVVVVSVLTLPLVACSSSTASAPADAETSPVQEATYDVEGACAGLSDVMTIVANARAGLETGRMEAQERDGWFHLSTSVLERLPSQGDHPVAEALTELQALAPRDPGRYEPTTVDTQEWNVAAYEVYLACEEAGHEPPTWMFTGG